MLAWASRPSLPTVVRLTWRRRRRGRGCDHRRRRRCRRRRSVATCGTHRREATLEAFEGYAAQCGQRGSTSQKTKPSRRSEIRAGGDVAAPDLVDVETVAVLRKRWLAGAISARRFAAAVDDLEGIELDRYPLLPLMRRAFELCSNVTAYDAVYVAFAEVLECELLTGDLAKAPGPRCTIRVLR